jgi:hypothetical protein
MSKETAVEYLVEQLLPKALSAEQYYHIEKAKAMEKEQIESAYTQGRVDEITTMDNLDFNPSSERYYNETYK